MTPTIEKLLSGEIQPPTLEPAEELHRLEEILETVSNRMIDLAEEKWPGLERYLAKTIARAEYLRAELRKGAA